MARCEKCSFELNDADKQCPNCGAIARGKDSTVVNTDFDAAELLRHAAALSAQDERATRQDDRPRDVTKAYDDGRRPEYLDAILREKGLLPPLTGKDPDASDDATSVFRGDTPLPSFGEDDDGADGDATLLAQSRDEVLKAAGFTPPVSRAVDSLEAAGFPPVPAEDPSDPLAAAGFPPPIDDYDDDDAPTGNMGDEDDGNDRTIQTEQSIEDFLDDDEIRASINRLREKAGQAPLDDIDEQHTYEMPMPRAGAPVPDGDGSTVQLERADILSEAEEDGIGEATVELASMKRRTQPTNMSPLPPIPLPKHSTQPAQIQPPAATPKNAGSLVIPAPGAGPQGSGFAPQPGYGPQGSGFAPQPGYGPQGSQFSQQPSMGPQGSQFAQQPNMGPQGSQFSPQPNMGPQGSQFPLQPNMGPQGSGFAPQPNMGPHGSGFPPQPNYPPQNPYGPRSIDSMQPPAPQAPASGTKKLPVKVEVVLLAGLVALALIGVALVLLF